ncbi:MAG TPA: choline kinase family protein [Solirubrobacteraceae bacterium]|nr:choline kinase family protein [Solirubrobacteraceae bacterium]HUB74699.1 choline kinase family protein [Solirubrobacteraceae bacterium]
MAGTEQAGAQRLEKALRALTVRLGPLEGAPRPLSGGITNHNFRVQLGGSQYVVRVHGNDTELLGIDRAAERAASEVAARLGIAPAPALALEDCLVTRFLAAEPCTAREIRARIETIAAALRDFHSSGATLPSAFWVPDLLERYAAAVRARGGSTSPAYGAAARACAQIAPALAAAARVPCHNDLLAGNVLCAGEERVQIVDWEYAGIGHPYFDLGNLAVNNELEDGDEERLLAAYHGEPPSERRRATLKLMRVLSDAREGAWGELQSYISDVEFDFGRYARVHFERLQAAVEHADFPRWLALAGEEGSGATTA